MNSSGFHTPEELMEDLRLGKIVILVDDEDRENEYGCRRYGTLTCLKNK